MKAAEAANAHMQMKTLTDGLLNIAHQAQSAGPHPTLVNSFFELHAKTTKLMKEVQPGGSDSAATADPAALLAFNLTMAAVSRGCIMGQTHEKSLAPIAENTRFRSTRQMSAQSHSPMRAPCFSVSNAGLPTPLRPASHFVPVTMETAAPAAPGPVPNWALPGLQPVIPNSNWHSPEWVNTTKTAAQLRRHSVGQKRQRKTKYNVVNPQTGERLVITSVVPFSWRHTRRLRIMDPKTGEEVLPLNMERDGNEVRKADDHPMALITPRTSTASRASGTGRPRSESATPARRQRRMSIAGGAVKEGSSWALEPAAGGYWDWPLSRQEKKDRVLLLTQLELLSEIEELQAEADASKVK